MLIKSEFKGKVEGNVEYTYTFSLQDLLDPSEDAQAWLHALSQLVGLPISHEFEVQLEPPAPDILTDIHPAHTWHRVEEWQGLNVQQPTQVLPPQDLGPGVHACFALPEWQDVLAYVGVGGQLAASYLQEPCLRPADEVDNILALPLSDLRHYPV